MSNADLNQRRTQCVYSTIVLEPPLVMIQQRNGAEIYGQDSQPQNKIFKVYDIQAKGIAVVLLLQCLDNGKTAAETVCRMGTIGVTHITKMASFDAGKV